MGAAMVQVKFQNPEVAAVFDRYPADVRAPLLALRALVFETAAETEGVGPLVETLKWGQPSYLTEQSRSGTTIRIDRVKDAPGRYALYVHCNTDLIAQFRSHYPDGMSYGGKRSILFDAQEAPPRAALKHCIALALTYHRTRKRR